MGSVVAVDQTHPSEAVLEQALAVLLNKGVLVMPTDSVYGIGCAAFPNNPAHRRIFTIKQRDLTQTLPWLVGTSDALQRYGKNVPSWMVNLAQTFWPGALTLVVSASDEVAPEYRNTQDNTIGLRMPASPLVCTLSLRLGMPLATTSANTHGAPSPTSAHELEQRIIDAADLTLDAGPAPKGVASTVVSCDVSGRPRILREGFLSRDQILEVAGM